ncbi:hypothetical protein PSPO01_14609 [Paraphaeosphaeria sporulosa]
MQRMSSNCSSSREWRAFRLPKTLSKSRLEWKTTGNTHDLSSARVPEQDKQRGSLDEALQEGHGVSISLELGLRDLRLLFPKYFLPDFVMNTSWGGNFWDGIHVERLGIEDPSELNELWYALKSLVQELAAILRSWGTFVLAQRENYPKRAQSQKMDVNWAATPTHSRWMPYLDDGIMDKRKITVMFGLQSHSLRETPKAQMKHVRRIICSEESADSFDICERRSGDICKVFKVIDALSYQTHSQGRWLRES